MRVGVILAPLGGKVTPLSPNKRKTIKAPSSLKQYGYIFKMWMASRFHKLINEEPF